MSLRDTFRSLYDEYCDLLQERQDESLGLLLGVLSRHHVLLIGPRGTAKSLQIRMLADAVEGATFFKRLVTRFSVPEELWGAIKLSALKEDRYERVKEGTLATAHFAFLDEIWKGNSSILNSLLTLVQERLFHENGTEHRAPLETLIGASNELPEDETLAALYDRFALRYHVGYIVEESAFLRMIRHQGDMNLTTRLALEDIHEAQAEAASVEVPDGVLEGLVGVRRRLYEQGVIPSDRRYKESLRLVKAHAWFQGRDEVGMADLSVLTNVLWDDPGQISAVKEAVLDVANPLQKRAEVVYDNILVVWSELQKMPVETEADRSERTQQSIETLSKVNTAVRELGTLREQSVKEDRPVERIDAILETSKGIKSRLQREELGLEV